MPTRLDSVVIDTADPTALARWWSQTLGWPVTSEGPESNLKGTSKELRRNLSAGSPIQR